MSILCKGYPTCRINTEKIHCRITFLSLAYLEKLQRLNLQTISNQRIRTELIEITKYEMASLYSLNVNVLFLNRYNLNNIKMLLLYQLLTVTELLFKPSVRRVIRLYKQGNYWNFLHNELVTSNSIDSSKVFLDIFPSLNIPFFMGVRLYKVIFHFLHTSSQ